MSEIQLRECGPLRAKITERQCQINRSRGIVSCEKCQGLGETVQASQPARADEVVLRFTGEDALILRRFEKLAENGHTVDENVATLVEMVLDGKLVLRG